MAQPQWNILQSSNLGTIPEGVFYQIPLQATVPSDPEEPVYYQLIAGQLPEGIQVRKSGIIEGIAKPVAITQGVPAEVSRDVTSKFAVRAYTERVVNGVIVVDRIADRTFTLTVTGPSLPEFITPAGSVGTFWDGTQASIQIETSDADPDDEIVVSLLSGQLPPGLTLSRSGLISGIIRPLAAGQDQQLFNFILEINDGSGPLGANTRAFSIQVYNRTVATADNTVFTADNTFITADVVPIRAPVLITPEGSLGTVRADNFYAFKFDAIDFDGDAIIYQPYPGTPEQNLGFPPQVILNPLTGWLYGYIPDQGITDVTYDFAIQVAKLDEPDVLSKPYYFSLTLIGNIDTNVTWITKSNLGTIDNGAVSTLAVEAVSANDRPLVYQLAPGSDSRLPQGLRLLPSGHIAGRVSFNTFALDGGTTTFDIDLDPRLGIELTTFDMKFEFTVNAYSPYSSSPNYQITSIIVTDSGQDYNPATPPTVTIAPPPAGFGSRQAVAGSVTIIAGRVVSIGIADPGSGYTTPPAVTITGGGGTGAAAEARVQDTSIVNPISVFKRFSITVVRAFDEPYERLYIKAMPPQDDRDLVNDLLLNQDIFPVDSIYRADDPNFGIAKNIVYDHAYGLTPSLLDAYAESLYLNHYWKDLTLGEIRLARALDANNNVLYEVIYSVVVDDLVNNQGESVSKEVTLPYPVEQDDSSLVTTVYPNSLINMRDQVVDQIGQLSPALPAWMTSKQENGRVLGFVPAWVIAYVKPGRGGQIIYNIQENFGEQLNLIDFKADRYELDRSMTYDWMPTPGDSTPGNWIPSPAKATVFDLNTDPLYVVPSLGVDGRIVRADAGVADGANTAFTYTPVYSSYVLVQINGVTQPSSAYYIEYGFGQNTVNFFTPPANASTVIMIQIADQWVLSPDSPIGTPTTFDGGSTTFGVPSNEYNVGDRFDKYLLFPRINILSDINQGPPLATATWVNDNSEIGTWINQSGQVVTWLLNYP